MIEKLAQVIFVIVVLPVAFAIGYGLWRVIEIPLRRWRDSTFDYVYIDEDGSARELNAEEEEYVTTAIFPNDDADLYIKTQYDSLTPEGRFGGYLRRRELPPWISVDRAPL
jgi:hypothetical protein